MRKELEDKLASEFEFMRIPEYEGGFSEAAMKNLYHAFGIEAGDGWYQLIYDLCFEIRNKLNELGFKQSDLIVQQVKEKFAGLRFYFALMNDNSGDWSNNDAIEAIVDKYEELSMETCEECGKPGEVRNFGWLKTLCDDCEEKRKKAWREAAKKYSKKDGGND